MLQTVFSIKTKSNVFAIYYGLKSDCLELKSCCVNIQTNAYYHISYRTMVCIIVGKNTKQNVHLEDDGALNDFQ